MNQLEVVTFHTLKDPISCYGFLYVFTITLVLALAMVGGISRLDILGHYLEALYRQLWTWVWNRYAFCYF